MSSLPNSLGTLTREERAALDQAVASILAATPNSGSGAWVPDAATAADRALAWIELRRRLIPRDAQTE